MKGRFLMEQFLQLLIFGIQLGIIYALIAMGYTMVYGILRFINFAHGDLVMIGAFAAYFVGERFNGGFLPAMLLAMVIPALLSVVIERLAYRPLRNRPRLSALITAIGVSIFLENFPRMIPAIGPDYRPFPQLIRFEEFHIYGNAVINTIQISNVMAATVLLIFMLWIVRFTSMGITVDRTIAFTFFIGTALAGAGGVLYSLTYPMIDVLMGI
jgi:branched-chain amino acid transport system permease protein